MLDTHDYSIDLTTAGGVRKYLSSHLSLDVESVEKLSGGYCNFAWRAKLQTPYEGQKSVVVKHAAPFTSANREMAMAVERQACEYKSLKTVTSVEALTKNKLVSIPSVYHYNSDMHVMVMQDAGSLPTLLSLMTASPALSASMAAKIGVQIGQFIAGLHNWGRNSEQGRASLASADAFGRTAMDIHGYQTILQKAAASGIQDPLLPATVSALAEQDRTCDETAVMGDFWSANMLIDIRESAAGEQTLNKIWIIDWENCRYGSPAVDIAWFAGDCYLLAKFYNPLSAEALRHNFLATYAGLARVDARQVAIGIGAFWIMWTKARGLGNDEELRECVEKGVQYIHAGWDGPREGHALALTRELVSDPVRARI